MTEVKFDFGDWDVESLRVSLFYPKAPTASARAGLWENVTGTQPESIDSRPREGVTRESGAVEGNLLVLTSQEERIDWLVQPIVTPNQQAGPVLTLKAPEDALPILQRAVQYSLETIPLVQRLAFSPSLIRQVLNPTSSLKQISKYLPHLDFDSIEGSDFVYQINRRRRSSSVSHARINRLAKWSTAQIGGLELKMKPSGQPRLQTTEVGFARKLELDLNTTPETGAMSNDKISGLFDELVTLAGELATKGDIS